MTQKAKDAILKSLETIVEICGLLLLVWPLIRNGRSPKQTKRKRRK